YSIKHYRPVCLLLAVRPVCWHPIVPDGYFTRSLKNQWAHCNVTAFPGIGPRRVLPYLLTYPSYLLTLLTYPSYLPTYLLIVWYMSPLYFRRVNDIICFWSVRVEVTWTQRRSLENTAIRLVMTSAEVIKHVPPRSI